MSKGSWRRPCQVDPEQVAKTYIELFGEAKLNVMSDEERAELDAECARLDAENARLAKEPDANDA